MKIIKWIVGIVGFLATLLAGSSLTKKNTKKTQIKDQIKKIDQEIETIEDSQDAVKKTLESKKKALKEIQKQEFKPKKRTGQQADKLIKDLLKTRGK